MKKDDIFFGIETALFAIMLILIEVIWIAYLIKGIEWATGT